MPLALYYASIPVLGAHFAEVCSKGEYGPPDQCEDWDAITAFVLRIAIGADEHSGLMAAIAGIVVAAFTGVLWAATHKLWLASERQGALARDEFNATHRPRLVLRDVFFSADHNQLSYDIANVGEAPANIAEGWVGIAFIDDPFHFRSLEKATALIDKLRFAAGEEQNFIIPVPKNIAMLFHIDLGQPRYMGTLYFFGWVKYIDNRGYKGGVTRLCVFRREWDDNRSFFKKTGNPDHEYSG